MAAGCGAGGVHRRSHRPRLPRPRLFSPPHHMDPTRGLPCRAGGSINPIERKSSFLPMRGWLLMPLAVTTTKVTKVKSMHYHRKYVYHGELLLFSLRNHQGAMMVVPGSHRRKEFEALRSSYGSSEVLLLWLSPLAYSKYSKQPPQCYLNPCSPVPR